MLSNYLLRSLSYSLSVPICLSSPLSFALLYPCLFHLLVFLSHLPPLSHLPFLSLAPLFLFPPLFLPLSYFFSPLSNLSPLLSLPSSLNPSLSPIFLLYFPFLASLFLPFYLLFPPNSYSDPYRPYVEGRLKHDGAGAAWQPKCLNCRYFHGFLSSKT